MWVVPLRLVLLPWCAPWVTPSACCGVPRGSRVNVQVCRTYMVAYRLIGLKLVKSLPSSDMGALSEGTTPGFWLFQYTLPKWSRAGTSTVSYPVNGPPGAPSYDILRV